MFGSSLSNLKVLNRFVFLPATQTRYAAAFLGGLFLSASFPKLEWNCLAWLGPGLILFSSQNQSGKKILRTGYYAGLSQYLFSLYWLLLLPVPFHAVAAWLGIDDRDSRVQWDYAQRRGAVREQAIAITFTRRTP